MAVTVTPTVEESTGQGDPPRIRLDVTATAGETAATVTRLNPDGATVPVRTTDGNPLTISAGTALVYDYEAPFGQPVRYSTVETPGTLSAAVTVAEPAVWLIHVGVPALSRRVRIIDVPQRARPVVRGIHTPMGRRYPVVQTDGQRKAAEYTLTVRTDDDDERAALDDLLDDAGTLLLNVPAGKGWGVGAEYVSVGDSTEARRADWGAYPLRDWLLPCTVVDRPVGGTQAERTLADLAGYGTLAALSAAYGTLFDVAVGP